MAPRQQVQDKSVSSEGKKRPRGLSLFSLDESRNSLHDGQTIDRACSRDPGPGTPKKPRISSARDPPGALDIAPRHDDDPQNTPGATALPAMPQPSPPWPMGINHLVNSPVPRPPRPGPIANRVLNLRQIGAPLFDVAPSIIRYSHHALEFGESGYPKMKGVSHFRTTKAGQDAGASVDYEQLYRYYRCVCAFLKFLDLHQGSLQGCRSQLQVRDWFLAWSADPEGHPSALLGGARDPDVRYERHPVRRTRRFTINQYLFPGPGHASAKAWSRLRNIGICIEHFIEERGTNVKDAIQLFGRLQRRLNDEYNTRHRSCGGGGSSSSGHEAAPMVVQVQDHMATLLAGLRARHNLRVRGQAVGEDLLKFLDGEVVKVCERIELTTREGARGHSDSSGDDSSSSISGGSGDGRPGPSTKARQLQQWGGQQHCSGDKRAEPKWPQADIVADDLPTYELAPLPTDLSAHQEYC
ncbi:hypothetical protein EV182_000335 [Spiromyces aspiralis]|uniref:Uncharacterized protein n=1 Tax=Spiromyces aspiralis TaxID=68401 RepID=A0ACC1HKN9_9FUNG|nr:hypothetical protein EV182_000335 [Spiromyces aspiralis]